MDNHGAVSTNSAVVYVIVKHNNNPHTSITTATINIGINKQAPPPHLFTTPNNQPNTLYYPAH
jgi:hypothetical protein